MFKTLLSSQLKQEALKVMKLFKVNVSFLFKKYFKKYFWFNDITHLKVPALLC